MHLAGLQNGRACVRGCNGVKGRSSEVAVLESPGMEPGSQLGDGRPLVARAQCGLAAASSSLLHLPFVWSTAMSRIH